MQVEEKGVLYKFLPPNAWKNKRCFIVGGGKSLEKFNFSKLNGELVIACNRAMEYCNPAIMLTQDMRLWGWYQKDLGEEAKEKFDNFKGLKVFINKEQFPLPDVINIPTNHDLSLDHSKSLPLTTNSGLSAICLAVSLGANPIYLLGFDLGTGNFHSGYPENSKDTKMFLNNFNELAPVLNKRAKIINLNSKSKLKCFKFGRFPIKKKKPLVVSFFTKETEYVKDIAILEKSIIKFGFEYDFYAQGDLGSWRKNVHDRIRILRNFLDKYQRDILYIDADGVMVNYPYLFDSFIADLGIVKIDRKNYWKTWKDWGEDRYEFLGGTMYMKNNKRIRKLLDIWEELDKPMSTRLSQLNLPRAIKDSGVRVKLLPANYCQIYDAMACEGEPIVEHFQSSRRYK